MPIEAQFCPFDGRDLCHDSGEYPGQPSGIRGRRQSQDSLVGVIVDERYEILQLLGEGGMGCVYRVRHRVLGRSFALKALRPDLSRDAALAERFVQEARAAAAISHPNVVSITDFGILERGQPYFVMELLEGRTLSSHLREHGPMEPERVALIARSVASALGAAHSVGVIHRDLKPDNVILLGDGSVPNSLKVLDFGLAKLLGACRLTREDIVYGTPQYMSPEQAAGEALDPRVDIYALGILMYEMLTGQVPFEGDDYMGVLTKQLYVEPAPLADVRPDLAEAQELTAIVMRCLRKDRSERFADMSEVVAALDELELLNRPSINVETHGRRSHPSMRLTSHQATLRRIKRLRWWAATAIGALALGVALGLLFGRLSDDATRQPVVSGDNQRVGRGDESVVAKSVASSPAPEVAEAPAGQVPAAKVVPSQIRPRQNGAGRSTGQTLSPISSRSSERNRAAPPSFERTGTQGSSEIANPWAK